MGILHMERIGGVAGFGTTRSRIRSQGQVDTTSLTSAEVQAVERLFKTPAPVTATADAFTLRLTRSNEEGIHSVVVPESMVPPALLRHLKDELL